MFLLFYLLLQLISFSESLSFQTDMQLTLVLECSIYLEFGGGNDVTSVSSGLQAGGVFKGSSRQSQ